MCGSNFSDYKLIIIFPGFSCMYIVLLRDLIIYFALVVLSRVPGSSGVSL